MKVFANSVPKSGTHLLLRLLTSMGFDLIDFGGTRPRRTQETDAGLGRILRTLPGVRKPGNPLGIGPHLVDGGRFPAARALLRRRGPEKVLVGVEFPREIGRRWLDRRLARVPDDGVVSGHCSYSPGLAGLLSEHAMRTVCILRDPRDTAVSHMHYLKKLPNHPIYGPYMSLPDDHERLMFSIRGGRLGGHTLPPLGERYRSFLGWSTQAGAAMVRFEDLIGPRGGGSEAAQREAVARVAAHLDVDLGEEEARSIARGLFGSGRTFRKGRAGGWREEFSGEHARAVEEVAGELLAELGYEATRGVGAGRR